MLLDFFKANLYLSRLFINSLFYYEIVRMSKKMTENTSRGLEYKYIYKLCRLNVII